MKQQLNLIDIKLLPVAARPSVATLLCVVATATAALVAHYGWERAEFNRTLLRSASEPAAAANPAAAAGAPDTAQQALRLEVERDELLLEGLARASDLPTESVGQLRQVAAALPAALWLVEVELSGRSGLRIAGGTLEVADLSAYARRLGEISSFKGRSLQTLTLEPRRPEPRGEGSQDEAGQMPPHHLFVLASEEPRATEGVSR